VTFLAEQEMHDPEWDALVQFFRARNPADRRQTARGAAGIAGTYRRHEHHWPEFQDAIGIVPLDRGRKAASKFQPICRHLCGLGLAGDETGKASLMAGFLDIWEATDIAPADIPDWIARTKGGMRGIYEAKGQRFPDLIDKETTTAEWYSPRYIFDSLGTHFDLDPASPGRETVPWIPADAIYTHDGLERPWQGCIWLNPPYGRDTLHRWARKFAEHGNGIMLVPDRTSTEWWQHLAPQADVILFLNKKIPFERPDGQKSAPFAIGSALVGMGEKAICALERAGRRGLGTLFSPHHHKARLPARNDNVYTGDALARRIINYLPIGPDDFCVDGCRGPWPGAFHSAMPQGRRDWCESRDGRDFLTYEFDRRVDWVITNPPYSDAYAPIAARAFRIAANVAFLVKLNVALGTFARHRAWREAGHGLREIVFIPWGDAEFTTEDGRVKAGEGFCLALLHWSRGWTGAVRFTYWDDLGRTTEAAD
jgi:hypothetical protein